MSSAWQDDFESLEDRRTMARAMRDARVHRQQLQASAPDEVRHAGADGGLHHRTPPAALSAECNCDSCQAYRAADGSAADGLGNDLIGYLARTQDSYLERYERARVRAGIERRSAELDAMRVRFTPVYGDD